MATLVPEPPMSAEQKANEQNALASSLGGAWSNFKQGKLISYRLMAILLLVCAGIGLWWYLAAGSAKAGSQRWMDLEEASTIGKLEDVEKNNPNTVVAKAAKLLIARTQLGPDGIDLLTSARQELRLKAVENIEKARDAFGALLEQFKDDPVIKPECLLGLAKAEMALVAVPTGPGQLTEFKGKVPKVIDYLDQLAASAPDTPWATDSKKLADALRKDDSEFIRVQRSLFSFAPPTPKLDDPLHPQFP
jgi:hypothetical protein